MSVDQLLALLNVRTCPDCRADLEPDDDRLNCSEWGSTWGRP